jgi:hypothetical protein
VLAGAFAASLSAAPRTVHADGGGGVHHFQWALIPCVDIPDIVSLLIQRAQNLYLDATMAEQHGDTQLAQQLRDEAGETEDEATKGYYHYINGNCQ